MTLRLLSQESEYLPIIDVQCFPKLVKNGIVKKVWDLNYTYQKNDSSCVNYLSTISMDTAGDTLLITSNTYPSADKPNFEGLKVFIDSDSTAIVVMYMDNSKTHLKGKSARKLKKEKQEDFKPMVFKILVKKDSSAVLEMVVDM